VSAVRPPAAHPGADGALAAGAERPADTAGAPALRTPAINRSAHPVSVARALARVEARQLARSPLLWSGFVLSALMLVQETGWHDVMDRHNAGAGVFYALLPAATTLLAANRAALRARRDGTEELLDSAAAPATVRTGGLLLGLVVPLALAAVIAGAWVAIIYVFREGFGRPVAADVLRGPALVAGAGALGVMLGRWVRSALAGPVACVAIAASILHLVTPFYTTRSQMWLSLFPMGGDLPIVELALPRPSGWHLLYLVGLTALAALAALLREGLRRPLAIASVATLAITGVAAYGQTRPLSPADWAARDALVADPVGHQVCEERAGATFCHYPRYGPLVQWWLEPVAGVLTRLPDGVPPRDVVVRQRLRPFDFPHMPDDSRARIQAVLPSLPAPGSPPPDDGAATVNMHWRLDGHDDFALAWEVASGVVGLPLVTAGQHRPCDGAGQARSVAALWLAAQSTPQAERAFEEALAQRVWRNPVGGGRLVPRRYEPYSGLSELAGGVAFDAEDAATALAMLRRPAGEVAGALAPHWDRISDPSFGTAALAGELGIEPAHAPSLRPPPGHTHSPLLALAGTCR
jgi:hypothetical protein